MTKKLLIIILVIIIIGGTIFGLLWCGEKVNAVEEVSLSILVEKINQEQVESITVRGNDVETILKDKTYLHYQKEAEGSLLENLINNGADAEKLKKVLIEIKEDRFSTISAFLSFLFPLGLFIGWFFLLYFLILAGFKIFKIKKVQKSKIAICILVIFLLFLFIQFTIIPAVFKYVSNRLILYFINLSIFCFVIFLLFKYYFLLSGKKLWQLLLYFVVISLVISIAMSALLKY